MRFNLRVNFNNILNTFTPIEVSVNISKMSSFDTKNRPTKCPGRKASAHWCREYACMIGNGWIKLVKTIRPR